MDTVTKGKTIDEQIEETLGQMEQYEVGSEEYLSAAKAVEVLCQARSHAKAVAFKGVPLETIVAVGANILGLLIVLNYEKTNIITSKAFGWISKGRNI